MIIIPTEKRFDWNYAPIMLFSIVLINILIFFVYQSGDNAKFGQALQIYHEENFLEHEWPFFTQYLTQRNELSSLEKFQTLYDQKQTDELIINMIIQPDFYRYLRFEDTPYEYFVTSGIENWFEQRETINTLITSTSISSLGLTPSDIKPLHLLSYQFLHGDIMHLIGNLFFLIVCGFAVEAAIGHWRFLAFYLVCGIIGGLLHSVVNLKETIPLVGASGAISGVMAMYLGLFRLKKIEFFYWLFIFVGYFRAPAFLILAFYIGKEFYQFFTDSGSNVAFMAHAGGFISGSILMAAAYFLNPKIFNQQYIEEDQSVDPTQEKLATIYDFIGKYQFEAAKKALERAIKEHGLNFDFALLRYNLAKIEKGENYQQYTKQLLTIKSPSEKQVNKIKQVWIENPDQHQQLGDEDAIKIAFNFTQLTNPSHAAVICDQLIEKNCTDTSLGILARKISAAFEKINETDKQKKYASIADNLLAGKF